MAERRQNWPSKRILFVILLLSGQVGLIWYGKAYNPAITLQQCLAAPERYDSARIEVATEAVIAAISDDGFILRQMGKEIKVIGHGPDLRAGEFVSLTGIFHKEGWIEADKIHVAKKRRAKIAASLLPIIVVLVLFVKKFTFNLCRFEFTPR
jgi:hypothetical protein